MEFGVHLPIMAFEEHTFSLAELVRSAVSAERLGFTTLCANDHLIYSRPWLDAPVAHKRTGKNPDAFPHVLGTMFFYLTDDRRRAEEVLGELLSPILGHPVELLRERVLVGSANECVEKLANLQAAGVRKVFLWPVADDAAQLAKFHEEVLPQLPQ